MKKVGYFFFAFLPIIIAMAIQFLSSFFLMGCAFMALLIRPSGNDSIFNTFFELMVTPDFSTYIMLLYAVICIACFGLWYYHSLGGDYLPSIPRTFSVMQIAGIVILVPGAQFVSGYLVGFVSMIFPKWLEQYEQLIETAGLDSTLTLAMLLYSVILAPVCEELMFRGVTMHLARKALPFWLANILQAFLFGFFHMNWIQGIYAFALGLVLGFVCEKGGSIYCAILLHMLFNLWGTVISKLLDGIEETTGIGLVILMLTIVSISLGFFLFVRGTNRIKKK